MADPTLRDWILKADAKDATINSLIETEAAERIKKLEKENANLRRDFEIVKAASTFF
jgi:transposase-like protein